MGRFAAAARDAGERSIHASAPRTTNLAAAPSSCRGEPGRSLRPCPGSSARHLAQKRRARQGRRGRGRSAAGRSPAKSGGDLVTLSPRFDPGAISRPRQRRPDRVRYGFVIDQRKCIGCHACTVACKEENHVPVGAFRTWVKVRRARRVAEHAAVLLRPPLQPLRERAVRDDLPHARPLHARRRHRRLRPRPVHRLQGLHAGLPVRRAVHRPRHAYRGEVPLLRASRRERARARVRRRLPGAGDHLRRPRRSAEPDRAHRGGRAGPGAQGRAGHAPEGVLRGRRYRRAHAVAADARADLHVGAAAGRRRSLSSTC